MSVLRRWSRQDADLVAAEEMPEFVRDHAGELRFVAHSQEQPRKDHREPRREHHRVEVGNAHQIDAEVLSGRATDCADQVAQIAGDLRILDQQVRIRDLLLDPRHVMP